MEGAPGQGALAPRAQWSCAKGQWTRRGVRIQNPNLAVHGETGAPVAGGAAPRRPVWVKFLASYLAMSFLWVVRLRAGWQGGRSEGAAP